MARKARSVAQLTKPANGRKRKTVTRHPARRSKLTGLDALDNVVIDLKGDWTPLKPARKK